MRTTIAADRLNELILKGESIVILGHENPDGDSIGSTVAMYRYLSGLGKAACIVINSRPPRYFDFLMPEGAVLYYNECKDACEAALAAADLLVFLDMNGVGRSGDVSKWIDCNRGSARRVLIDHHLNPQTEGFDVVISDTEVSSADAARCGGRCRQPPPGVRLGLDDRHPHRYQQFFKLALPVDIPGCV